MCNIIEDGDAVVNSVHVEIKKHNTLEFAYNQLRLNYRKLKRRGKLPARSLEVYENRIKHLREIIDLDLVNV